jgi:hypothetical protein
MSTSIKVIHLILYNIHLKDAQALVLNDLLLQSRK